MKRLLLIMAMLIASAGAYALDYTTTIKTMSITDTSTKDWSGSDIVSYKIELTQSAVGKSDGKTYNSSAIILIRPATHQLAGTYRIYDATIDYFDSKIIYSGKERPFGDDTAFTITDNGDGTCTFSGAIYCTTGHNYFYNDYTFTPDIKKPDPFESEPAASEFTFEAVNFTGYDQTGAGKLLLDLNTNSGNFAELCFMTDTYDIPAGTYTISDSGEKGTIAASTGMDSIFPTPSYVLIFTELFDQYNYFLTSGSVTVSYENGKMNVSGAVRSAHGSTININATGDDPFDHGGPTGRTILLDVSDIQVTVESSYFVLSINAKYDDFNYCNGIVRINSTSLVGEYDYEDFYTWNIFDSSFMDVYSTKHTASVAASGYDNEYIFNCSIVCENGNTYVVENARFTYEKPEPSGPYALEPEASEFTFTADSSPYVIDNTQTERKLILQFFNGNSDIIQIAFAADSEDDILSGSYIIDESMGKGTVCASPGNVDYSFQPSYIGVAKGIFDTDPYFLTSGKLIVGFENGNITITGKVKSYKGSEITLDIKGADPFKHKLPSNILHGYLTGFDATYMLAHDINTNPDGTITIEATIDVDKRGIGSLNPYVEIDGTAYEMDYDLSLGACKFTTSGSYSKGDKLKFSFKILESSTQTINHVVE